jgi:hypothetical protein
MNSFTLRMPKATLPRTNSDLYQQMLDSVTAHDAEVDLYAEAMDMGREMLRESKSPQPPIQCTICFSCEVRCKFCYYHNEWHCCDHFESSSTKKQKLSTNHASSENSAQTKLNQSRAVYVDQALARLKPYLNGRLERGNGASFDELYKSLYRVESRHLRYQ